MESFAFPHLPAHLQNIYICFFANVSNSKYLRARLISASTLPGDAGDAEREAVNFAFLDPKAVRSLVLILDAGGMMQWIIMIYCLFR